MLSGSVSGRYGRPMSRAAGTPAPGTGRPARARGALAWPGRHAGTRPDAGAQHGLTTVERVEQGGAGKTLIVVV
jgi:hypothetical protein